MATNAWFDAIAPYHPTAVGVYSRLGRRPAAEATHRNKNIATLYASYQIFNNLMPQRNAEWRQLLQSVGLNPDDDQRNTTTAIGIGNMAADAVIAHRKHDGMNQLGDEGGRKYNRQPYADYTGYQPVNTAYELRDPSRWQPDLLSVGNGTFRIQQFVTASWGRTLPYSYKDPNRFGAPAPINSDPSGPDGLARYKKQVDEVLATSAALDDRQKMTAELFNNKFASLATSIGFIWATRGLSVDQFVQLEFLTNAAAFDAGIATWNQKYKYDAVRPFSAIRHVYKNQTVTAWGGPGKGTVKDMPSEQWRSYINAADHPEYPSGSACFCAAHAQVSRRFLGTDKFGWSVPVPKGSSRIEPGITPAKDIVLGPWDTWTDFERECGQSRLLGGVHFQAAIDEGARLCKPIADVVFDFVQRHIDGTAPAPEPARK
ncbi:MAG: vanadium-dependent haloperoxidase [Burkholderiaceae bacterium]